MTSGQNVWSPDHNGALSSRRWMSVSRFERWGEQILDNLPPSGIAIKRPSKYKATWYRALAQLGLRRSSAGGFGSYIPETTAAG